MFEGYVIHLPLLILVNMVSIVTAQILEVGNFIYPNIYIFGEKDYLPVLIWRWPFRVMVVWLSPYGSIAALDISLFLVEKYVFRS